MFRNYVTVEFTIINCCEEDVLTASGDVNYDDGVAVNGSDLWSEGNWR